MDIAGIPDEANALFQRLLSEAEAKPLPTAEQVVAYREMLRKKAKFNEFLDMKTLEQLTDRVLKMLASAPELTIEQRAVVCAAIAYFLKYDDADHDFESILGLEDDAEVLNAVIAYIGLPIEPIAVDS